MVRMCTVPIKMVKENPFRKRPTSLIRSFLGVNILHHAIDSKNFDTIMVIIKQFDADNDRSAKHFEMNREVGMHKWTPLYRAGLFLMIIRIQSRMSF